MAQVTMSPEQLEEMLSRLMSKMQQLNPLEQKKYDEEVAKQRRRDLLAVQLGKAEAQAQRNKRLNCSHMRFSATAGKHAGALAPKGTPGAEWCTGGQAYQNGLVMIFCSRCHSDWWFQPTQDFYTYIIQNGIDGMAPPPDSECVCIGCYEMKSQCRCAEISMEHVSAHPTVQKTVLAV